jgi:hypothetical protein
MALGDVGPGRTGPEPPVDAVQDPTIIDPRNPARLVRQKWRDDRPLEVGQLVATLGQAALLFARNESAKLKRR